MESVLQHRPAGRAAYFVPGNRAGSTRYLFRNSVIEYFFSASLASLLDRLYNTAQSINKLKARLIPDWN
jgi:hypothetical protein